MSRAVPMAHSRPYVDDRELTCDVCGYTTQPPAKWADTGVMAEDVRRMRASEDLPMFCARCGREFDPAERERIAGSLPEDAWSL